MTVVEKKVQGKAAQAAHPQQAALAARWPSLSRLSAPLVASLIADAKPLALGVERLANGAVIVDGGIQTAGGQEAGRRIAEICLGGLGTVALQTSKTFQRWPRQVAVTSDNPVLACLGSQYAGWSLTHGEGSKAFRAMGSGPGRAMVGREELFAELAYRDKGDALCLALETDQRPPLELIERIAQQGGVAPGKVTIILTPTRSIAGAVQIVARVLEVALHKAHTLGFPLHHILEGSGNAPLPPQSTDFLTSMGRTNDAILFGGEVRMTVDCGDAEAEQLVQQLPSGSSKDYGKPFAQVFKDAGNDFYRIDPLLFAPALASVTSRLSGRTWQAGRLDAKLLDLSFG